MKRLALLFALSFAVGSAEEITLTKSAVMRMERGMVSLKAGTVVEVLDRDEKTLTIRYNKNTGTIPAASVAPAPDTKKKDEPATPPKGGAQTIYGKAVEKAKENANKHEKNAVKPADDVLQGN